MSLNIQQEKKISSVEAEKLEIVFCVWNRDSLQNIGIRKTNFIWKIQINDWGRDLRGKTIPHLKNNSQML